MKITIICDVPLKENNGTAIAALNLIHFLKKQGHLLKIICPESDIPLLEDEIRVPKINFFFFNGYVEKNGVTLGKPEKKILRAAIVGADVVHLLLPFALSRAAIKISRSLGIPLTASFHCQAENLSNHIKLMNNQWFNEQVYRNFYRAVYRYCDCVHYPTQFIKNVFENSTGPTNGFVISNGVHPLFLEPRKNVTRPAEYEDKFVVLCSGRYSQEKAQHVLIEAAKLSKHKRKLQLIFAGDGPFKERLKKQAADLTIPPLFRFFKREDLADVIAYADLYVHTAEVEIEAVACLEAICGGLLPVIADSPRSATRYFALTQKNLFTYDSPQSLAETMDYWLENAEEKQRCLENYRNFARRFALEECMKQMEQMFFLAASRRKENEKDAEKQSEQKENA